MFPLQLEWNLNEDVMKICITVLLLWVVPVDAFAQNRHIVDSLEALLKNRSNSERYAVLRQMVDEYIDKDNEKALAIAGAAAVEASRSADSALIVSSGRTIG